MGRRRRGNTCSPTPRLCTPQGHPRPILWAKATAKTKGRATGRRVGLATAAKMTAAEMNVEAAVEGKAKERGANAKVMMNQKNGKKKVRAREKERRARARRS